MSNNEQAAWRSIRCADVQWGNVPGVKGAMITRLYWACATKSDGKHGAWADKTLGDLADMGERAWSRAIENCGPKTIEAIKLTIDYAAAGHDVTRKADAYVPRPWKDNHVEPSAQCAEFRKRTSL